MRFRDYGSLGKFCGLLDVYLRDGSTDGYTSIVCYAVERSSPLRGADISNAPIELLSVTTWGKLDFLTMPPRISDPTPEFLRLAEEARLLAVTTPSRRVFETVRSRIDLYSEMNVPVMDVIENMKMQDSLFIRQ